MAEGRAIASQVSGNDGDDDDEGGGGADGGGGCVIGVRKIHKVMHKSLT